MQDTTDGIKKELAKLVEYKRKNQNYLTILDIVETDANPQAEISLRKRHVRSLNS